MIPDYQPPFSLLTAARAVLSDPRRSTVDEVEAAFARTYGMPYAILLPSCRAGISWALRACASRGMRVLCPAYTCNTVWESVIRADCELDALDISKNSFLMDEMAVAQCQTQHDAVILCEIYGYMYDIEKMRRCSRVQTPKKFPVERAEVMRHTSRPRTRVTSGARPTCSAYRLRLRSSRTLCACAKTIPN